MAQNKGRVYVMFTKSTVAQTNPAPQDAALHRVLANSGALLNMRLQTTGMHQALQATTNDI
jgi:hypothetical protein